MQMAEAPPDAAGSDPPLTPTVLAPAAPVTVAPVQVVEALGGLATTRPVGRLSVAATALSAWAVGLIKVICRVDRSPGWITAGVKRLVTPTLALADRLVVVGSVLLTPWLSLMALAGTLFWIVPVVIRVTLTVTVQLVPWAMLAPDRPTLVPLADAVATPPGQVVVAVGAVELIIPVWAPPAVPSAV